MTNTTSSRAAFWLKGLGMACLTLLASASYAQTTSDPVIYEQLTARLLADHSTIEPGKPFQLGLQLSPTKGWHTYWSNPADSGLPTRINWDLPNGVKAGEIQWPAPHVAAVSDIMNYGYDQTELLLVPFTLSDDFSDNSVTISATANWLVCADECIPQQGEFSITLTVGSNAKTTNHNNFTAARLALPLRTKALGGYVIEDSHLKLNLQLPDIDIADWQNLRLFPVQPDLIDHAAAQSFLVKKGQLYASIMLNEYFERLPGQTDWVLTGQNRNGVQQAAQFTLKSHANILWPTPSELDNLRLSQAPSAAQISSTVAPLSTTLPIRETSQPIKSLNLWLAILFAVCGGLILNLMPCVLPVLSFKLLSFAEAHGQELRTQRKHALAYGLGVLISFLVIAGLLLGLRAAGNQIGWGFQLQTPWFVAALIYLMFALGLSLSGVVIFGQKLMGVGEELTTGSGFKGSFFTGVLAVVVASPCSAPFMGSALGWAISQPPLAAMLVFAALAFGMALPMVLIAWWPWFARLMPKPGIWMERLKQALAFPMYLTAAWLLWVLGKQAGLNSVALIVAGAVMLSLGLWIIGLKQRGEGGVKSLSIATLAIVLALVPLTQLETSSETSSETSTDSSANQTNYSAEGLQALVDAGQPVFVDMTAAWCITCQVNERVVLKQPEVQQSFADNGVVQMVGDWTNKDPEITKFLERFGRNGVPVYVLFDAEGKTTVLPQVLSKNIVINSIRSLTN
jgi:thiol:disulfide interchange protein DsbD